MAQEKNVKVSEDRSFSDLLNATWCPICGAKLSVEMVDGKRKLKCSKHGEMKWYLEQDPFAAAAVAEHCDAVGIVNIEGA